MIRLATKKDIPEILNIYEQRMYKEESLSTKYTYEDYLVYIKHNLIYVYEIDKNVVAYILYFNHYTWGYIETISVKKEFRNKNIGSQLLRHIQTVNRSWETLELCYHIEDNLGSFFSKLDFVNSNQITKWIYKLLK